MTEGAEYEVGPGDVVATSRGVFIPEPGGGAVVYKLDFDEPVRGVRIFAQADAICKGIASAHVEVSRDGEKWEHTDTLSWHERWDWRHEVLWVDLSKERRYDNIRTLYVRLRMGSHAGGKNEYVASFRELLVWSD